jgi:hypothetical protein
VYLLVYSILGVIQGMGFTYLSSVLSTIGMYVEETQFVYCCNMKAAADSIHNRVAADAT